MATSTKGAASRAPAFDEARDRAAVAKYLEVLDHAQKPAVLALRKVVLGAHPQIREGIKWNAPSFRVDDYFATMNLRAKGGATRLWLVLHAGAAVRGNVLRGKVPDPEGLLEWLADDRGIVTFDSEAEVADRTTAITTLVRHWIRQLPSRPTATRA